MISLHRVKAATLPTQATGCRGQACCSSPAALCYWCVASFAAWVLLALIGIYWHPLHANSATTILFAAAVGCFANWFRNRTFHCRLTAWLFLAGGAVFLVADMGVMQIEPRYVWPFVAVGTLLAFILEWRHSDRVAG